jgi:tRNA(Ile)-lysidine synthase
MEASILTLAWSEDFPISDTKKFETEARARRYQALGRACRDRKIQALMAAHHGDDQAETVLMRIAKNRLRSGLKGMQNVEWIPECGGIYGVHHSGKKQVPDTSLDIPFPVEQGGIRILRPLLAFEKSRLIATCESQEVKWAEDKSNQKQTLTSRNAIRHIYRNHQLPKALSIQSLVDVSLNMQRRIDNLRSYADFLFDECLMKLDIQTGSLLVRFPPFTQLLARPIETQTDKNEAMDVAYCLMERVADLVSPKAKSAVGQLAARIDNIYPEFMTPEDLAEVAASEGAHFRNNFTVYGVWWRQWDKASPFDQHGLPAEDFGSTAPHPKEWLLTRQSLEYQEARKPTMQIVVLPSPSPELDSDYNATSQETYQLFDSRFWIRLHNRTRDTLVIRVFEKPDMRHLPTTQRDIDNLRSEGPRPERFITAALALIKPSDVRFTLPAVFRIDSTTGEESLIGFPTLNVRMDGFGAPREVCDWSVRYKKIEFGRRPAGDIVVPGIKDVDIVAEDKKTRMKFMGLTRLKVKENRVVDENFEKSFTGYKRVMIDNGAMRKVKNKRRRELSIPRDKRFIWKTLEGVTGSSRD